MYRFAANLSSQLMTYSILTYSSTEGCINKSFLAENDREAIFTAQSLIELHPKADYGQVINQYGTVFCTILGPARMGKRTQSGIIQLQKEDM